MPFSLLPQFPMEDNLFYLAPLQGFTKIWYRNAFHKAAGGAHCYFTPFFEQHASGGFDPRLLPELDLVLNQGMKLIPQVVANDVAFLGKAYRAFSDMGYAECNLNMGCPFPMLVKRHKAGGLLDQPEVVYRMLDAFFEQFPGARLSVKMRAGLNCAQQGVDMVKILSKFPITELIVHPRLVIQQYKGVPDWDAFAEMVQHTSVPVVLNGDLNSVDDFDRLRHRFPHQTRWMMGRGWLANPNLLHEVQGEAENAPQRRSLVLRIHRQLFHLLSTQPGMPWQLQHQYLVSFWKYPSVQFPDGARKLRRLSKLTKPDAYAAGVLSLFSEFEM